MRKDKKRVWKCALSSVLGSLEPATGHTTHSQNSQNLCALRRRTRQARSRFKILFSPIEPRIFHTPMLRAHRDATA